MEPDIVGYEWHSNGGYRINRKTLKMTFELGGVSVSEWRCQFLEKNRARLRVAEMTKMLEAKKREGNLF